MLTVVEMEFAESTCTFIKVDGHIADLIMQEYGTLEDLDSVIPQCGCGARYKPWCRGESQVVELCTSGRKPLAPEQDKLSIKMMSLKTYLQN